MSGQDVDNKTSWSDETGAGDSANGIVHGQTQICHLPGSSWKPALISGLLTAVTAEPRAPGTGKKHICASCICKFDAWLAIKQELGEILL